MTQTTAIGSGWGHDLIGINPGIFVESLPLLVGVVELQELSLGMLGAPVWRSVCETRAQSSVGGLRKLSRSWSCCAIYPGWCNKLPFFFFFLSQYELISDICN